MTTVHPRPMSSAPLDGTPVRLFASVGSAIASFWSVERSGKAFGPGDYREGWFLLDDDTVELDEPTAWEPLTSARACSPVSPDHFLGTAHALRFFRS